MKNTNVVTSIPNQYKKLLDDSIDKIVDITDKLYPIMTEMGKNDITIDGNKFIIIILRKKR